MFGSFLLNLLVGWCRPALASLQDGGTSVRFTHPAVVSSNQDSGTWVQVLSGVLPDGTTLLNDSEHLCNR